MSSPPWWQRKQARDRVALSVFAALGVGGIVLAGVLQLAEGDQREVVVTLEPGAGQAAREEIRRDCGRLPGVGVVPDRGAPERQARLPVRFAIAGSTIRQQAALDACLARHDDVVRGIFTEGAR